MWELAIKKMSTKEMLLWNYGAGEDSWESIGLQGDPTSQSQRKSIFIEYSLGGGGLILKLKFQYFEHLMWRANSLEKTLMLGKLEGRKKSQWQRMRRLDGITKSMDMGLIKSQEMVKDREAWLLQSLGCKELDMTEWLNNEQGILIKL